MQIASTILMFAKLYFVWQTNISVQNMIFPVHIDTIDSQLHYFQYRFCFRKSL